MPKELMSADGPYFSADSYSKEFIEKSRVPIVMNSIRISIKKALVRYLSIIMLFLVMASVSGSIAKLYIDAAWLKTYIRLFNLNTEVNVPSAFSSLLFMVCAGGLAANGKRAKGYEFIFWYLLSAVFTFLSADEFLSIHERLTVPIRSMFHTSGLFYFAWIIPYSLIVIFGLLTLYPFFRKLPSSIRNRMILSAVIFLSGAVGVEAVEGAYFESMNNVQDLTFDAMTTLEETLEMSGMIYFLDTLLDKLKC